MTKVKPIILTGLGTTPLSEDDTSPQPDADCGMLGIAEELRNQLSTCTVLDATAISWSVGAGAGIAAINAAVTAAGLVPGDFIIMQGHSFGNNLGVVWSQSDAATVPDGITVIYIGHDPCRELLIYHNPPWFVGPRAAHVLVHLQHKGRPAGVSGTAFWAFRDLKEQEQIDVSDWTNPCLAHVDCTVIEDFKLVHCTGIIKDARVRAAVYAVCRGVILDGKSVQQVIDELSAAWLLAQQNAQQKVAA